MNWPRLKDNCWDGHCIAIMKGPENPLRSIPGSPIKLRVLSLCLVAMFILVISWNPFLHTAVVRLRLEVFGAGEDCEFHRDDTKLNTRPEIEKDVLPGCSSNRKLLVLSWHLQPHAPFITLDDIPLWCDKSCVSLEQTRDKTRLQEADIVVFNFDHMWATSTFFTFPYEVLTKKPPGAVFVLSATESPHNTGRERYRTSAFLANFHMLWSYHHGLLMRSTYAAMDRVVYSDVLGPPTVPFNRRRSAPVVALVTNCGRQSIGRSKFLLKLIRHVAVHSYGKVYNNRCLPAFPPADQGKEGMILRSRQLNHLLMAHYKFVFAVENSLCTDYITEKYFRGLMVGAIPIVASLNGNPNYTALKPNLRSPVYLNAFDYQSVAELGKEVERIASSEKLFNSFMKYRWMKTKDLNPTFRQVMEDRDENSAMCKLVRKMSSPGSLERLLAQKATVNETCEQGPILDQIPSDNYSKETLP